MVTHPKLCEPEWTAVKGLRDIVDCLQEIRKIWCDGHDASWTPTNKRRCVTSKKRDFQHHENDSPIEWKRRERNLVSAFESTYTSALSLYGVDSMSPDHIVRHDDGELKNENTPMFTNLTNDDDFKRRRIEQDQAHYLATIGEIRAVENGLSASCFRVEIANKINSETTDFDDSYEHSKVTDSKISLDRTTFRSLSGINLSFLQREYSKGESRSGTRSTTTDDAVCDGDNPYGDEYDDENTDDEGIPNDCSANASMEMEA